MRVNGVDRRSLDLIPKNKRYSKYFKMLKVGIAEEAG